MADHETRDVDVGLSARSLLALLATVALALAAVGGLLLLFGGAVAPPPGRLPDQAADFPAPALRTAPLGEPAGLAREKAAKLGGLEDAMRRLEATGWPPEEKN